MLNDEIVDEVRAIREAHAAKFGYDLRAIYADLKKSEAERIAAGHTFVSPPSQYPVPDSALQRTRFAHRLTMPIPPTTATAALPTSAGKT